MITPIDIEQVSADDSCMQRYEDLRVCILGTKGPVIEAWGLNVLMRYGMARWMQTWDECVMPAPHESNAGSEVPLLVPGTWETDVTILLSNMAINLQEETV